MSHWGSGVDSVRAVNFGVCLLVISSPNLAFPGSLEPSSSLGGSRRSQEAVSMHTESHSSALEQITARHWHGQPAVGARVVTRGHVGGARDPAVAARDEARKRARLFLLFICLCTSTEKGKIDLVLACSSARHLPCGGGGLE
jgi:hypothetical protein